MPDKLVAYGVAGSLDVVDRQPRLRVLEWDSRLRYCPWADLLVFLLYILFDPFAVYHRLTQTQLAIALVVPEILMSIERYMWYSSTRFSESPDHQLSSPCVFPGSWTTTLPVNTSNKLHPFPTELFGLSLSHYGRALCLVLLMQPSALVCQITLILCVSFWAVRTSPIVPTMVNSTHYMHCASLPHELDEFLQS